MRRIPRIFRSGFKALRIWKGYKSENSFILDIIVFQRRSRFMRYLPKSTWPWSRRLAGKGDICYIHFEAIANLTGIPTGIFLISTLIASKLRDGRREDVDKIILGIKDIVNYVERTKKESFESEDDQVELLIDMFGEYSKRGFDSSLLAK